MTVQVYKAHYSYCSQLRGLRQATSGVATSGVATSGVATAKGGHKFPRAKPDDNSSSFCAQSGACDDNTNKCSCTAKDGGNFPRVKSGDNLSSFCARGTALDGKGGCELQQQTSTGKLSRLI